MRRTYVREAGSYNKLRVRTYIYNGMDDTYLGYLTEVIGFSEEVSLEKVALLRAYHKRKGLN